MKQEVIQLDMRTNSLTFKAQILKGGNGVCPGEEMGPQKECRIGKKKKIEETSGFSENSLALKTENTHQPLWWPLFPHQNGQGP